MYYYMFNDNFLFSKFKIDQLQEISEEHFKNNSDYIYYLNKLELKNSRVGFSLTHPSLLEIEAESISLLNKSKSTYALDEWTMNKISSNKVKSININHPKWKYHISLNKNKKYKVNIFALGDVGGTLLTGLKLLGGDCIYRIGIYDRTEEKVKRYEQEKLPS